MLVHRRVTPTIKDSTHSNTWVEGGIVKEKYLAQEHNTVSLDRVRTPTARYEFECTNHKVTTPPANDRGGEEILIYMFRQQSPKILGV